MCTVLKILANFRLGEGDIILYTVVGPASWARVEGSRSHVSNKGRTMRLRSLLNELLGVC